MNYEKQAIVFKAFCDENRLRILELLRTGEKCACMILEDLNIKQSTLSHHMKILCDAEIVSARKDGKWTHYSISNEGSAFALDALQELLSVSNVDSKDCRCQE